MYFGFNFTFFPQFLMGYLGMNRRYHHYAPEFQIYHVTLVTRGGGARGGVSDAAGLPHLVARLRRTLELNPWGATGLEWQTTSPPPRENFERSPMVAEEAYAYHPEAETPRQEHPGRREPHNPQGAAS